MAGERVDVELHGSRRRIYGAGHVDHLLAARALRDHPQRRRVRLPCAAPSPHGLTRPQVLLGDGLAECVAGHRGLGPERFRPALELPFRLAAEQLPRPARPRPRPALLAPRQVSASPTATLVVPSHGQQYRNKSADKTDKHTLCAGREQQQVRRDYAAVSSCARLRSISSNFFTCSS